MRLLRLEEGDRIAAAAAILEEEEAAATPEPEKKMSHRERLANLLRAKLLVRGEFTFSSGKKSDYYLDCRLTTLDPEGALQTGYCVLELLDEMGIRPDAIGGLSMGADR